MTHTPRFQMPLIAPEQAQKHVTHNEALLLADAIMHPRLIEVARNSPPGSATPGATYGIGDAPTGAWQGHAGDIATRTEGGWRFLVPTEGMTGWNAAAARPILYRGGEWVNMFEGVDALGIGAAADAVNRLTVRSQAALFTAIPTGAGGNGDVRLTLNKQAPTDSATLVFQSDWSGRAEIGLAGTDDFAFKVSGDGEIFTTAMTFSGPQGFITMNAMAGSAVSHPQIADGVLAVTTSYAVPAPQSGNADDIDSISGGFDGALLVLTGTAGQTLTFRDGTGNLKLGGDRVLDNFEDSLMLIRRGGDWIELSYANNG